MSVTLTEVVRTIPVKHLLGGDVVYLGPELRRTVRHVETLPYVPTVIVHWIDGSAPMPSLLTDQVEIVTPSLEGTP